MSTWLKNLISPPHVAGEEAPGTASMLNAIVWTALIFTLLFIPTFLLVSAPLELFWILVSMLLVELGALYLNHNRKVKEAGMLLAFAGWLILFVPAFFQGGLASPFTLYSVVMVAVAILILGPGYGILLGSLTAVALSIMLVLGRGNLLPETIPLASAGQLWLHLIIVLCSLGGLFFLVVSRLRASLARVREVEQHLEESNLEQETTRSTLEQRLSDRTSSLERRAQQFQAQLEIANTIGSVRDLDPLLEEIVSSVGDRLGYPSTSIFLADKTGQSMILRASNVDMGRQMVERGFSLKAGQTSVVGNAADTLRTQLGSGATQGSLFLVEKVAPETGTSETKDVRTELAIPLVASGKLLGVLDIQSESETPRETPSGSANPPGFDRDSVAILQTLAENISIAIENAQLLSEKQQTVDTIQRAYSSMSRETWQKLLQTQQEYGYQCSMAGDPVIATGPWSSEMLKARDAGEVIRSDEYTLAIPIKIREQVAGVVKVRKPEATGEWNEEEIELVETLSERLSTALESAQLYDETRRRAERERLTGEITARVRASNDPQVILQTAVRELRRALKADHAQPLVQSSPGQARPGASPKIEAPKPTNPVPAEENPTEAKPAVEILPGAKIEGETQQLVPSESIEDNDASLLPAGQD